MPDKDADTLYCSFCGKSQHEVRKLIAGPKVFICDECTELCMEIVIESGGSAINEKLITWNRKRKQEMEANAWINELMRDENKPL